LNILNVGNSTFDVHFGEGSDFANSFLFELRTSNLEEPLNLGRCLCIKPDALYGRGACCLRSLTDRGRYSFGSTTKLQIQLSSEAPAISIFIWPASGC
jgi:hypothetical protein